MLKYPCCLENKHMHQIPISPCFIYKKIALAFTAYELYQSFSCKFFSNLFFKPCGGSILFFFFNVEPFLTKVFITLLSTTAENQYWHLYREFKVNFDPDTAQCRKVGFAISLFSLLHHCWLMRTQKIL